jgi:hypothetical protein
MAMEDSSMWKAGKYGRGKRAKQQKSKNKADDTTVGRAMRTLFRSTPLELRRLLPFYDDTRDHDTRRNVCV